MTNEEQLAICKVITRSCMWGHGGIGSVILQGLDKELPMARGWRQVENENAKATMREHMGVITNNSELERYLAHGYWLVNYDEDGCSLFNPPPMNGLCKYVSKELAALHPHPRY